MKICVIMSTYNGEKYIEEQIESIINQQGIEKAQLIIYVRDDGSQDHTVAFLEEYRKKKNISIVINKGENVGAAKSFMKALQNCPCADYYAFCDQDDVWKKDKLISAIKSINHYDRNEPVLWASNYSVVDDKRRILCKSPIYEPCRDDLKVLYYNNVPGCLMVFNSSLMQQIRKLSIENVRMHDIVTLNIAIITGKVIFNNESFVEYRQHGNNVIGYGHKKVKLKKWIKDKVKLVREKEDYNISEYAGEILNKFQEYLNSKQIKEYELIKKTKESFIARVIILNKWYTKNEISRTTISIRSKILLGIM